MYPAPEYLEGSAQTAVLTFVLLAFQHLNRTMESLTYLSVCTDDKFLWMIHLTQPFSFDKMC